MENDSAKFKNDFKRRLYLFVLNLVKFVDQLDKKSINDVIGRQLLRSGTSVLANYIEANSASSKRDFINFFTHSLKSANETKVWLTLLRDTATKNELGANNLLREAIEIAKVLATSILTLKGKR